ncbi:vacuolar membrane-associated protein iml1, partial [Coemansia nantahalensis]
EMVHGWAQMAERCGMRLVEAPRAQDTSTEINHPFHSPINITLELPPPPAESIFDADWVAEVGHLGESDSEPESEPDLDPDLDGSGGGREEARRARTLRRMARCLPTYPFERELLEEQDFVLDVEAEANYPAAGLVSRDHTFERAEHEFTQYVHRSGTAFVQIRGPGQFLWINNYLYASHQSYSRQSQAGPSAAQQLAGEAAAAAAGGTAGDAAGAGGGWAMGRSATGGSGAAPSSTVPVYYPARHVREMWPHQYIKTFARYRTPDQRLELPEAYSQQIVDELGRLPTDFDSVNAAVTRVAEMDRAFGRTGWSGGQGDGRDTRVPPHGLPLRRNSIPASLPASDTASEWAPVPVSPDTVPGDPAPDALRANFLEICKDKNSLEMFWHYTVRRYRTAWRSLRAPQGPACESPTTRAMVVDVLGDALWQSRRGVPPDASF